MSQEPLWHPDRGPPTQSYRRRCGSRWPREAAGWRDKALEILDQRRLPGEVVFERLETVEEVWSAIRTLAVRGAPAIGVAAAFGMVLAARTVPASSQAAVLIDVMKERGKYLKTARPTAVNLEWAVDQMTAVAITERSIGVRQLQRRLLHEAKGDPGTGTGGCARRLGKNGVRFYSPKWEECGDA